MPPETLALLAVFQPDQRTAARLTEALIGEHRIAHPKSWAALERLLATVAADGCIIDADHPSRREALKHIRRIRNAHPGLAIVAVADLEAGDAWAFRLGENGVDGLLPSFGEAGVRTTRSTLSAALDVARAGQIASALHGRFDPAVIHAVVWSFEHGRLRPTVGHFASAMNMSLRSLRRMLRGAGLPHPHRLLLWGRLLHAAARLVRDRCTVEEAAYALRYSTGQALARAMKRETGMTPGEVVRRGGLAAVLAVLFPRGGR